MALDERCDVRVIRSTEKVSFPVAGHSAVIDLGRPFADGNRIDDLSQSALRRATLGLAHLPRRAQVCHQLLFQHTACLNKETAIDRLVESLEHPTQVERATVGAVAHDRARAIVNVIDFPSGDDRTRWPDSVGPRYRPNEDILTCKSVRYGHLDDPHNFVVLFSPASAGLCSWQALYSVP